MTSPNSRDSYHAGVVSGAIPSQRDAVLECIRRNEPLSRRHIAEYLRLETASVSARVNALIESGLVEEWGEEIDGRTGRRVALLRLVPHEGEQLKMSLEALWES